MSKSRKVGRTKKMNTIMYRAYLYLRQVVDDEGGQDLVEYALVVALIAFGAISGMRLLSTGLNRAFSSVASTLTANV